MSKDILSLLEPPPEPESRHKDPRDPLLGELIQPLSRDESKADVVLLGCPDETGLLLNNGRPGAGDGPDAIRRSLYKLSPGCTSPLIDLRIEDAGNLRIADNQELTHERLTALVQHLASRARTVVLLGGSHELSAPGIRGYAGAGNGLAGVVLIDAHLDVRDLRYGMTNGSPFYQLIEGGTLPAGGFVVLGAQQMANSPEYYGYLQQNGHRVIWLEDLGQGPIARPLGAALKQASDKGPIAVSMDIDAARQEVAPGTGAPCADGLSARQMIEAGAVAGRHPGVGYLDLMEVSPALDIGSRTAGLAATIIFGFLRGLQQRVEPAADSEEGVEKL